MYYKLGRAGKALDRFGVIEFATTIAPGVRDVLLTGKVYEATKRNARNKKRDHLRRRRARRAADRPDRPVPRRQPGAGRARPDGPDQEPGRLGDAAVPVAQTAVHLVTVLEEMPVQETADGIAELREHGLPVGGVVVNQVRPRDLDDDDLAARPRRQGRPSARSRAELSGPGSTGDADLVARAARRGPRPRRAPRARGRAAGARRRARTCRRTSCRGWPAASTSAGSTSWPPMLREQGLRDPHDAGPAARVGPQSPHRRPPTLDVDALLDDPHTGIIVCCGSGGVGKTTTSAALALRAAERGPQGRRAHHRPGPPAGPVDGHRGARQHPAAGRRRRRRRDRRVASTR